MNIDGLVKIRYRFRSPQQIVHQRAAARTAFDENQFVRGADLLPGDRGPQPDQFAEDLRDFRCRDKVACGAEGVSGHIIAVFGMTERQRHKVSDGDRSIFGDPVADQGLKG